MPYRSMWRYNGIPKHLLLFMYWLAKWCWMDERTNERTVEERRGSEWALKVMWWIPMDVWRSECNNCLSHMHNGPLKCMGNSLSKSTRRFFIFIYIDKTNTPIEHAATVALLFYGSTYFISLFPYLSLYLTLLLPFNVDGVHNVLYYCFLCACVYLCALRTEKKNSFDANKLKWPKKSKRKTDTRIKCRWFYTIHKCK